METCIYMYVYIYIYIYIYNIASLLQQCHNSKPVIFQEKLKGFEVLKFSMSATTTQLLSSGEICKLRYDTISIKSASANVSFYTSNSKCHILSCDTLVTSERYVSHIS